MPTEKPSASRLRLTPDGSAPGSGALITTAFDGVVATVTLNRPSRRNALNREMLVSLGQVLAALRLDARLRAVVLTGAGSSFCSGVDISAEGRRTFYRRPQQTERLYQEHGQDVVRALQTLPQVTIAAVNGPAVGWGTCLTTSCDFRLVADSAFFRIPEIGYGMYYDVGCLYGLLALIGPAQARRMTMLGEDISAAEALRMGLADRVVPAGELAREACRMAGTLARRDAAVVRILKRQLAAATTARRRHLGLIELELTTAYYAANLDRYEGLAASQEGRPALFSRESEAGTLTRPPRRGEGGEAHGFSSH